MVKYRVSELAKLLDVSDVAIRKRIKNGEFEIIKEEYNKRIITFVCLDEEQIKELGIDKKNKDTFCAQSATFSSNDEIRELILNCTKKYEDFYSDYATKIDYLNQQNTLLAVENAKLKAQLTSIIEKYNTLAKRINANIAKKSV